MQEANVIYDDEETYGKLEELIRSLKENKKLAKENGDDVETFDEAIKDAEELLKNDNGAMYKMWYNPMGAFMFERLYTEMEIGEEYWISEVRFQCENNEVELEEWQIEEIAHSLLGNDYIWGTINDEIDAEINKQKSEK